MKKLIRKKQTLRTIPRIVSQHHLERQYHSGKLVLETGIDPENYKKKVTRLRRKCVYDEMMNRGSINADQRNCAEQYAILCEKAFGQSSIIYARISNWFKEGSIGCKNWEPTPIQREAYDKLLRVWEKIGRYHRDILNMIILGNMSSKEISLKLHLNLNYTMGQVLSAFILLEEALDVK